MLGAPSNQRELVPAPAAGEQPENESVAWRPSASVDALRVRADLLSRIRRFFATRGVLEVETPLLSTTTTPDPNIHSFEVASTEGAGDQRWYLQTSPEHFMKRLLAAGSGCIYQLGKVFRDGEAGRQHNPEFTLLEWYRCGYDHLMLMGEVEALIGELLDTKACQRLSYHDAFLRYVGVDIEAASLAALRDMALQHGFAGAEGAPGERDVYLNLLLSHVVAPRLGHDQPVFIYDFPASQASLAHIRPGPPPVAERFELFFKGIELANGYHELSDCREQRQRFLHDRRQRRLVGLADVELDERLLAALTHGLPACAGVALGVDRVLMLILNSRNISDVMAFPAQRA